MSGKNCIVSVSNPCEPLVRAGAYDITDIPNWSWSELGKVVNNGTYQEAVKAHERAYQNLKSAIQNRFRIQGGKFNFGYTQQSDNVTTTVFSVFDELDGVHFTPNSQCNMRTSLLVGVKIFVKNTLNPKQTISLSIVTYNDNVWNTEHISAEVATNKESFITINAKSERDIYVYLNEDLNVRQYGNVNGNSCGCGGQRKVNMFCGVFSKCTVTEVDGEFLEATNESGNSPFCPVISCGCDIDEFMCINSEIVKTLFLAMLEKELLNLRLNNSRVTFLALYGDKQARERITQLNGEIEMMLIDAVGALFSVYRNSASCGCVECGKTKVKSSI